MGSLHKRRLGRSGLFVSELGLGAMDTPHSPEAAETVSAAIDLGIDFIDTARDYEGSEHLLGRVMRERSADGLYIASKTFRRSASGAQYEIDRSLAVLGLPRVSLYQLHDISKPQAWAEVMAEGGALEGLKVAQYRGLIEHIGLSTHGLEIAREAVLSGEFETVMVEYSAFYPTSAAVIELAAEHDVGVIVMRPLGGSGRTSVMRGLADEDKAGVLTPPNLLRYVLSHPGVSVAIPGARYPSRVIDNVAAVSDHAPMGEAEKRELEVAAAKLY
jgi:aryl-alcohol dehydrogenase-like predicted oxidoreductase